MTWELGQLSSLSADSVCRVQWERYLRTTARQVTFRVLSSGVDVPSWSALQLWNWRRLQITLWTDDRHSELSLQRPMRVGKYLQRSYFRRSEPKMSQNWWRMQTRRHSGRKICQLQSRWWTSVKTEFLHIFQDLGHECETCSYKRLSKRSADRDLTLMNHKNLWVTTAEDAQLCKWLIWGLRMKWLTLSRTLS
jgi:hypothetical protein